MSQQPFAILPRIADVDGRMTPARQTRLRKGHPEVSFCLLAGAPLAHAKATPAGREECRAYALLWSARRLAAGTAQTLPSIPELDERGLGAEMVAWELLNRAAGG
jgi:predicted RNase H-like nuclease